MKRHVRIADCADLPLPQNETYRHGLLIEAFNALAGRNLRFDNKTGIVRDNTGELERFKNPADHKPHADRESVMRWVFSRYILNSASRMSRGFNP